MSTDTKIEDLKYNELKALAKESGLDASGTKEDLVARIKEAGVTGAVASNDDDSSEDAGGASSTEIKVQPAQAQERVAEQTAEKALRTDAAKMKAHLDAQPKVSIMIPFEVGENPEVGKNVPFHVNVNGHKMDIPRGVYVEVPMQIADMIKERLESEGKIGSEWRIDRDNKKQEALG